MFAGDDVVEAGFVDSPGWLSQSAAAGGRMPYEMVTHWQRWDVSRHILDPAVAVAVETEGPPHVPIPGE